MQIQSISDFAENIIVFTERQLKNCADTSKIYIYTVQSTKLELEPEKINKDDA